MQTARLLSSFSLLASRFLPSHPFHHISPLLNKLCKSQFPEPVLFVEYRYSKGALGSKVIRRIWSSITMWDIHFSSFFFLSSFGYELVNGHFRFFLAVNQNLLSSFDEARTKCLSSVFSLTQLKLKPKSVTTVKNFFAILLIYHDSNFQSWQMW